MKVKERLIQARFIEIHQAFAKNVGYFSNRWKSKNSNKHHLAQIPLAINWRYWQTAKIYACVWRIKVASCKRASLNFTSFSQKMSDTFLIDLVLHLRDLGDKYPFQYPKFGWEFLVWHFRVVNEPQPWKIGPWEKCNSVYSRTKYFLSS